MLCNTLSTVDPSRNYCPSLTAPRLPAVVAQAVASLALLGVSAVALAPFDAVSGGGSAWFSLGAATPDATCLAQVDTKVKAFVRQVEWRLTEEEVNGKARKHHDGCRSGDHLPEDVKHEERKKLDVAGSCAPAYLEEQIEVGSRGGWRRKAETQTQ